MVDILTRGSLGEFGSLLLDFYIANAIWINTIVAVYAIFVVFAHRAYAKTGERIKELLITTYGESVKNKNEGWFSKTLAKSDLDWDEINTYVKTPVISPLKSIALKFKSAKSIKKLFGPSEIKALFSEPGR